MKKVISYFKQILYVICESICLLLMAIFFPKSVKPTLVKVANLIKKQERLEKKNK